jgi:hypothetical protein
MKVKVLALALFAVSTAFMSLSASAQEKKQSVGTTIDKTANAVGHKTAEVAVKGASKVSDKRYKGMMAPDGSDVYINGNNRKYYVNKKGKKVYLKASQITAKAASN